MDHEIRLLEEHHEVTRRYFLQLGAGGIAGLGCVPRCVQSAESDRLPAGATAPLENLTPQAKSAGGEQFLFELRTLLEETTDGPRILRMHCTAEPGQISTRNSLDLYRLTGEESHKKLARRLFEGLRRAASRPTTGSSRSTPRAGTMARSITYSRVRSRVTAVDPPGEWLPLYGNGRKMK
jgi:hypothetical protein